MAGFSRRDNAPITETIRPVLCRKLLNGTHEEVTRFLRSCMAKIKEGTLPVTDLAIPRRIHKDPEEYAHTTPWVRGIKYSNKHFNARIKKGDYVKTIYVRRVNGYPPTTEVAFLDINQIPTEKLVLDTKRIIEKTIKMKNENLLSLAGISWLQVKGYKELKLTDT